MSIRQPMSAVRRRSVRALAAVRTRQVGTAALALGLGMLGVVAAPPAAASAATSCYGGAKSWELTNYAATIGPYTTTSRCSDINLKVDQGNARACVIFIDHTSECNSLKDTYPGQWVVVADDVRNGTRFKVRVVYLEYPERSGKVAF